MSYLNIISLGAGKQSSYMLITALQGNYKHKPNLAIFADTGNEPNKVYDYFQWLKKYVKKEYNFDVIAVSNGHIINDTIDYYKSKNKRGASLPFRIAPDGAPIRRQCTNEYKIIPIRRYLQKIRGKNKIRLWIGISVDEIQRMRHSNVKYIEHYYPLIEKGIYIDTIIKWYKDNGIEEPMKSSCITCPFHSNNYWQRFKKLFPDEFKSACDFDEKIRNHPKMKNKLYLHKSCKPLKDVDFEYQQSLFPELIEECEGLCGL